ncbi:hypothetical protein CHO01_22070 [Cellulomonas hominis]|uniref:Signal peptidase I n=2 Tax=Cellulomonas hominis TaxID=156981 RepID=A0A511FCX6_9CELL|nr:signal peptidase I [Cellulomonas hominis]MBB5474669.1 signal peptidase I [Cellulomonas hominis]GEL47091.1 hypothetical protein CHO01_22070 [Cellulomonas hominis]
MIRALVAVEAPPRHAKVPSRGAGLLARGIPTRTPVGAAGTASPAAADGRPRELNARARATGPLATAYRRVRSLLSALVTAALLVVLATNFLLPVLAERAGLQPYAVLSGSMEPLLHTRTTVLVDTAIDADDLKSGEVIAFMTARGQTPTTHRITERFTDDAGQLFYRTQGDANEDPDPKPVSPANVLGVLHADLDDYGPTVAGRQVPIGQAVTWTRTAEGRIALLAPAVAALVIGELGVAISGSFADPRTWTRRRARR